MKTVRNLLIGMSFSGALFTGLHLLHAQETTTPVSNASPDSIVQITADAAGLQLVSPTDLPQSGTFLVMAPGYGGNLMVLPYPCMPLTPGELPVYAITGNSFLVDDTGGQALAGGSSLSAQVNNAVISSILQTQANTVANLIMQAQGTAQNQQTMAMGRGFSPDYSGGGFYPNGNTNIAVPPAFSPPSIASYGTNLWLAQPNVASGNLSGIISNRSERNCVNWNRE